MRLRLILNDAVACGEKHRACESCKKHSYVAQAPRPDLGVASQIAYSLNVVFIPERVVFAHRLPPQPEPSIDPYREPLDRQGRACARGAAWWCKYNLMPGRCWPV